MKLVDANVLLYSVNSASAQHDEARGWLDAALSGAATVCLAWVPLLAFLRLSTRDGVFERPLTVEQASTQIGDWLAAPSARLVNPTVRHAELVTTLLRSVGTGGNLVNDAHLAALAIEHRTQIVTYDADFARFSGVRWARPSLTD